jgi:hypothetical protein
VTKFSGVFSRFDEEASSAQGSTSLDNFVMCPGSRCVDAAILRAVLDVPANMFAA